METIGATPAGPSVLYFGNFPGRTNPIMPEDNAPGKKSHSPKSQVMAAAAQSILSLNSTLPAPDLRLFTDGSAAGVSGSGSNRGHDLFTGRDVELGRTGSRVVDDAAFVVDSPRKFPPHVTGNFLQHRGPFSGSGAYGAAEGVGKGYRTSSTGTYYDVSGSGGPAGAAAQPLYFRGRLPHMGKGEHVLW